MIQDPRMLELTKYEWWETLNEFDRDIIMGAVVDVKKIPGEFPSIQKFYEISKSKQKIRQANQEMQSRQASKKIDFTPDTEVAAKAREEIRQLFRLKKRN